MGSPLASYCLGLVMIVAATIRQAPLPDVNRHPALINYFGVDVIAVLVGVELRRVIEDKVGVLLPTCSSPYNLVSHFFS